MSKQPDADAVSVAMEKLAALPDAGGKKGYVAVPFPVTPEPPFALREADWHGSKHTTVDIADLNALEPLVKRAKVARMIQEAGDYSKIPRVCRNGGEDYIVNGHHRLTADYLLGMTKAAVNLLDRKASQ